MRFAPALFVLTVFSASAIAAPSGQPAAGMTVGKAQPAAGEQLPRKGKVLNSIDASIYTYIELTENGKNVWIAAPTVAVKKGDMVRFSDGAVMSNFHSKSLNRTFESIVFVGKAAVEK
ncbi:MAG: hypothetical protein HZC43_05515 [Nitrosomonadales bacterium]|nr:hypothetical protein [Nitrosomonadales bacterium]